MNHLIASLVRRNRRAFAAALLSYLLLAGQTAPMLVLASAARTNAPGSAASQTAHPSGEKASEVPSLEVTAAAPAPAPLAFTPTITASKVDTVIAIGGVGVDPDGIADPDQLIEYQVTITNTGTQATNVTFSDTVDVNTTLQPGTVRSTPLAGNDSYNVLGNVRIQVPDGANDLLNNDQDPDTGTNSGVTATAESKKSAQCGACATNNVTINADGSFTYDPPPGYNGTDSFTYTNSSTGDTSSAATVTLTITGMIWFIDNSQATNGDGRLTSPFNNLASFAAINDGVGNHPAADDNIFLYRQVATDYTGGTPLLSGQKLVGQGATATLQTITGVTVPPHSDALPPTGGTNPVIVNAAGNDVTIAAGSTGNLLRGVSFGNATGSAIASGAGFGTLTISEVSVNTTGQALNLNTGTLAASFGALTSGGGTNNVNLNAVGGTLTNVSGSLSGSSSTAFNVAGGNAALTYNGNVTNTNGQRGISVVNPTGGSLNVAGIVTVSGTGAGNDAIVIDGNDANAYSATISSVNLNTNSMDDGIVLRDLVAGSSVTVSGGSVTSQGTGRRAVEFESENTAGTYNFSAVTFDNSSGDGFSFLSGQTGTYSFGATTINTPNGGTAVAVTNSSAGITFASISETGGTNGLNISGATGSFTSTTTNLGTVGARLTGTAVTLTGNSAPVNLGSATIFSTIGVVGSGSNTGTFTTTGGAINTLGGAAFNIVGPAGRMPLAVTLGSITSVNSAGAGNIGTGVNLELVSGSVTVNGAGTPTSIDNSANIGLRLVNNTAAFSFANRTSVVNTASTAVFLNANTAALGFADLDINPDGGQRGLHATSNSGTLTTTSGDITTTTGIPVEIVGTSSGSRAPLNMTLNKVSANGATNGIILTNTNGPGASVGFVVNGDGSNTTVGGNDSGGIIQNTTGADDDSPGDGVGMAVRLNFADEVVLRRMTLTTSSNYGIYGENSSNFTFEFSKVNGTNGTDSPGSGINNTNNPDASVYFNELTSAALFKDALIEGGLEDNVRVINTAGLLNRIVFNNVTIGVMDLGNARGDNGILLQARNNATMNVTIQDSDFTHARGDIFQFDLTNTATADLIFDNNTVNNQHPFVVTGGGGITISGGGSSGANTNLTYEFDNNTFRGARGDALLIIMQTGSGSASGRIEGNTFGVSGINKSCSTEAHCIEIRTEGRGAQTVLINNNQIRQYTNFAGIYIEFDGINTGGSTGTIGQLNATVTNNTIEQPSTPNGSTQNGFHLNFGASSGDNYQGCVDVLNNNAPNSGGTDTGAGTDYVLRQRGATTVRLPGYGGAAGDESAVETYIIGRNIGTETVFAQDTFGGAAPNNGGGFTGGAACAQPPAGAVIFNSSTTSSSGSLASLSTGNTRAGGTASSGTASMGGVTSQPFVAMPLGTARKTSAQPVNTLAPVAQQQQTVPTVEPQGAITDAGVAAPANPPVITGNNINWNVGTLEQGQSVTITFRVKVNNPYTGGANVSNQGTVNCTECSGSVSTDDTGTPAPNDATLTPINAPPDIVVKDASGPEPSSGSSPMAFTVVLSKPSATNVTVNFTTADDTPGTGKAVAGTDYTSTSGTLTFTPGQTVQTISVHVLADASSPEPDETFFVNLTGATGGNITDPQAVGTITTANPPGAILISEIRTFGPAGATQEGDDFVEIYNNSDSPHTVADGSGINDAAHGYGLFRLDGTCVAGNTPVLVGIIPNGTIIPARGHYLFVGSQYSLGAVATGNQTMTSDLPENANVGLFKTPSVANLSTATRLDAVGFSPNTTGNNCDLLREGGALPQVISGTAGLGQHSFYRDLLSTPDIPADRNDNAKDFLFVDTAVTNAAGAGQQRLGAPGPENMASAKLRLNVAGFLLDQMKSSSAVQNRLRKQCSTPGVEECDPNRSKLGTMSIRRRLRNDTGGTITQLRVRVVEITTAPWAGGATADVRAISSLDVSVSGISDPDTCGAAPLPCTVTVKGTTVQAPTQALGGGYNSTMIVTLPGGGLPAGQSINLQFLLGVQESGSFRFLINVEALP